MPARQYLKMQPIELRLIMRKLRLQSRDLADLFDQGIRTVRRHVKGEARIDGPERAVLRLLYRGRITLQEIRATI